MISLHDYSENDRKFYESIGLLVARRITAEKAAEIAGYSFSTYLELLKKASIYPYSYGIDDYNMDMENIDKIPHK